MGEVLIKVDHVSKKFAKDLKKSLLYGLADVFSGITRKKQDKSLRKDEFWAVKDISFEVRRGECLGLIGHNGAGKSTLLKILNGLIAPDEGSVTMYGKVGALIELGAGFNPILTGRENIYNNGAIIGFSKQEIEAKYDEIVAFAEIEEFIDMPVQNYSSGMKVRLGFAIAAQMEPDVLIIDEVLAVGDAGFRGKCYDAIAKMSKKSAIIFVSHSMPMISRMCNSVLLMKNGDKMFEGNSGIAIEKYYDNFSVILNQEAISNKNIKLIDVDFINVDNHYQFKIHLESNIVFHELSFNLVLMNRELLPVAQINSKFQDIYLDLISGKNEVQVNLDSLELNPDVYILSISIHEKDERNVLLWNHGIKKINLTGQKFYGSAPYIIKAKWN